MVLRAASEFGPFDDRLWFNTAHQGPLPRSAVEAICRAAAALKAAPYRIGDDDFSDVPEWLRALLGRLVGSAADQIAPGNSTSHGLHLIANGCRGKTAMKSWSLRGLPGHGSAMAATGPRWRPGTAAALG